MFHNPKIDYPCTLLLSQILTVLNKTGTSCMLCFIDWLCRYYSRELLGDGFRNDYEAAHVPLHDHLLLTQLSVRGGELDLLPNPKR